MTNKMIPSTVTSGEISDQSSFLHKIIIFITIERRRLK